MKKKVTRVLSIALIVCMLCTLLPVQVFAQQPHGAYIEGSLTHINPLYADTMTEADLVLPDPDSLPMEGEVGPESYSGDVKELAANIRREMKLRKPQISIYYKSPYYDAKTTGDEMKAIFYNALTHTGVPTEGDYLRWQYGGWKGDYGGYQDGVDHQYYLTFTYNMTYYTTAQQETEMDLAVPPLIDQFETAGPTDYEKIKAAYDYICENITYDYTNLEDNAYKLKFTAYAALINKTAVCQGYANLLYRMALEMGIDCRLITGDGGGPHAWNIIGLDGKYYNADSTWDAGTSSYSYFLVSPDQFPNHVRNAEYDTPEFHQLYPMDAASYVPKPPVPEAPYSGTCGSNTSWNLDPQSGALKVSAGSLDAYGSMDDYASSADAPWYARQAEISSVIVDGSVRHIGSHAFDGCQNLRTVTLQDGIAELGDRAFANCPAMETVEFRGNAPIMGAVPFENTTARALYPAYDATWTAEKQQQAGGNLTWETIPSDLPADAAHFPDANFRTYLTEQFDADQNGAFSQQELDHITKILCENLDISDLTGIEYFTNLEWLECQHNHLKTLNVRENTKLAVLECDFNELTELDVSANIWLEILTVSENQLTKLDTRKNSRLNSLIFYSNCITDLDVSQNKGLLWIDCSYNPIKHLDLSQNAVLERLVCSHTLLTEIDLSHNPALIELACGNSFLTVLDVSGNPALEKLSCREAQLTSLDLSQNPNLTTLNCGDNVYTVSQYPSLDYTLLPGSFDVSKVSNVTGGTFDPVTHTFTFAPGYYRATYYYDTGKTAQDESVFTLYYNIPINEENFPDPAFREYVMQFDLDSDGAFSYKELQEIITISCDESGITSLKGIEHFHKVSSLYASINELTELDLNRNTKLRQVYCYLNKLTSLKLPQTAPLEMISCFDNQLTELDITPYTELTELECATNQLKKLDITQNPQLTSLSCWDNQLSDLDIRQNPALTYLECSINQLQALDVSMQTELIELGCMDNRLTELNLISNAMLETLSCGNNQLSKLDFSNNPKLKKLYCFNNRLKELHVSGLTELTCHNNQLSALDISACPNLQVFTCYGNLLNALDLRSNAALKHLEYGAEEGMTVDLSLVPNLSLLALQKDHAQTSLDLSLVPNLSELYLIDTAVTALDLSQVPNLTVLRCNQSEITSLDLRGNPNLTTLDCSENRYQVTDLTADYTTWPGNFDVNRVVDAYGGSFDSANHTFTFDPGVTEASYDYDCGWLNGNGIATFYLSYTDSYEGSCGTDVNWVLNPDTGVLTVSRQPAAASVYALSVPGAMDDYPSAAETPWSSHRGEIRSVIIETGVSYVGSNAFAGCENLIAVTVEQGVAEIGDQAFANCPAMQNVEFQGDAPDVSTTAFQNTSASVTYPSENETWTPEKQDNFGGNLTWEPKLFKLAGANMKLGNELAMYFYVNTADLAAEQHYYAVISKDYADRETATVRVEQEAWETYGTDGRLVRVRFNGIAAKEMTDEIRVQIFRDDGTPVSEEWTDSVRDYAGRSLAKAKQPKDDLLLTTIVDMLNYGADAQKQFHYNEAHPANAGLTEAQKAMATQSVSIEDYRIVGKNYGGSSLKLENNISLVMYFKNITPEMYAVVTFQDHMGHDHRLEIPASEFQPRQGMHGVIINELVVADARQIVKCEIYDQKDHIDQKEYLVASASDSMESYVFHSTGGNSASPIYKSIMKFAQSAFNFLHKAN